VLERRHVTFYARSSGVPEDRAERDIVLTYVLRIMSDRMLPRLAFKGGTCLKKIYFGKTGRFSMDLDFTSIDLTPRELSGEIKNLLHKKRWYGIDFEVAEENFRSESYLAVVRYAHSWNLGSFFEVQVSLRELPVFPPEELPIHEEIYFRYCEFQSFPVKCMQRDEILSEKIRAAFQRASSRDLYDLYLFAERPFNREHVKALVAIKCWNVRDPFNPELFLDRVEKGDYNWEDLGRLLHRGSLPPQEQMIRKVLSEYAFLGDLDNTLLEIVRDSKAHRKKKLVTQIIEHLREKGSSI